MNAGNKFGLRAAVIVTAIASATVIALAVPAGAHVATAPPDVSCDQASVDLSSFPQTSTITFHVSVNGSLVATPTTPSYTVLYPPDA